MSLKNKKKDPERGSSEILPSEEILFKATGKHFNDSQKAAVYSAMKNKITLVQGPPGTGKTSVLSAIVHNWNYLRPYEKIMVCAPSI